MAFLPRCAGALITGGLRARGWTWLLPMLWVPAGAASTGYFSYITTKPYSRADVNGGSEEWRTAGVISSLFGARGQLAADKGYASGLT
jgi:hypothetical protein